MRRTWLTSVEAFLQKPLKIKGYAIHTGTTRNLNRYVEDELRNAASTLKGVPVYLEHVSAGNAVGKVVDAWYDEREKAVAFEAEIYDEEVADRIKRGLIRHVSIAADYEILDYEDGVRIPRRIAFRELSLVAVPGDREANIITVMESLVEEKTGEETCKPEVDGEKEAPTRGGEPLEKAETPPQEGSGGTEKNEVLGAGEGGEERAVRYRRYPLAPEEREWDADAAEARIRRWASSDGSGEKDKIDWAKYGQAFAWYDPDHREDFTGYKLPHHDVVDGRLVTVWRGVAAAMAALLGARGGVQIPSNERRAVYNHLAAHYQDFDREPPELREGWWSETHSEEEIGKPEPEAVNPQPQPGGEPILSAGGKGKEVEDKMEEKVQPKGLVEDDRDPISESRRRFLENVKKGIAREQWTAPFTLPETPSARIATFVRRSGVLTGKPGDTVNIPYVKDFSMDILASVGDSLTAKTDLYGTVQATIKEAAAYTEIPYADLEKLSEELLSELEGRFSEAALRAVDKHIFDTLVADAEIPEVDKSGETVVFDAEWIVEALSEMIKNRKTVDPGDCLLAISPGMYEALLKDVVGSQSIVYARPDLVREGRIAELFGVKIAVTHNLPQHDAVNGYLSAYLVHRDSMVFAPKRELLIETERDTVNRKVKLTGSITFAVGIVDKNSIVEIKTAATS